MTLCCCYDVLGRPTQIDSNNQSVLYTYDPVGNRETIETQIDGIQQSHVTYGYDELNRLDTVTDSAGVTDLTYNKVGMLTIVDRPNNVKTTYNYDSLYQVTGMLHEDTSINTDLAEYTYGYDAAGNRESMTHTYLDAQGASNTVHYDYGYDKANRLTSETRTFNLVPSPATEYRYDANGNRVQEIRPNDDIYYYTYNKNDQLTRIDNPDYTYQKYEYDARGNLDTVSNWQKGVIDTQIGSPINYTYDARNQLIDFDGQASFAYDHDGRRISATAGVTTTNYLWDEFSTYGDVVLETGTNGTRSYTLANGMLISQTDTAGTVYFLPDAQGSTRALTDSNGALGQTYDYDAFGNLLGEPTLETNYLYTGQQYDDVSGLYSLRARYYDSSLGRFLSRDVYPYDFGNPFDLNRYLYTANNPATWSDPSGYNPIGDVVGMIKSVVMYGARGLQSLGNKLGPDLLKGFLAGSIGWTAGQIVASLIVSGMKNANFLSEIGQYGGGYDFFVGLGYVGKFVWAGLLGGAMGFTHGAIDATDVIPKPAIVLPKSVSKAIATFLLALTNTIIIPAIDYAFGVVQYNDLYSKAARGMEKNAELGRDAIIEIVGAVLAGLATGLLSAAEQGVNNWLKGLEQQLQPLINKYREGGIFATFFLIGVVVDGIMQIPLVGLDERTPFDPQL